MHHIKEYIQKIVDDGDRQEMEELSDILEEVIFIIKDYDEKEYKKYEMCLYKMAYGERFNKDMAEEIISKMQPYHMRWTLEETREVQNQYGLDNIRDIDFWIVMNSAYNDYRDLFGDNIEMYARFSKDFIQDEDAKDGKVFLYFTSIPK